MNWQSTAPKCCNTQRKFHSSVPCMCMYPEFQLLNTFQELFNVTSATDFLHFPEWLLTTRGTAALCDVSGDEVMASFFHLRKSEIEERTVCEDVHKSQNKQEKREIWKKATGLVTFFLNIQSVRTKIRWFKFYVDSSRPLFVFSLGLMPGLLLC